MRSSGQVLSLQGRWSPELFLNEIRVMHLTCYFVIPITRFFGHFLILTGQRSEISAYARAFSSYSYFCCPPSANRNEDHLLLALSAFWKWRARIGTHSVLDPRPKEYPHHPPNTQYPNAWSTAYLCQKEHGPSNTSSYLFLNFTPIPYFNSSFRVSGFQVVSFTFVTIEIPRS